LPYVGGLHHRYVWAEAAQSTLGFTQGVDPDAGGF
jgi:hypothetical protein